jgi:outer membrane receptor for ferrienterochelin and colicin
MKRLVAVFMVLAMMAVSSVAQVTTSGIGGLVTAGGEEAIGATITAKHMPSGAIYRGVTNVSGRYAIDGMRAGGPYEVEISYIGYQTQKFTDVQLSLGQNAVLDAALSENSEVLQEIVVVSAGRNNMRTDRAGSVTSVNASEMAVVPTVSRSLNDIMKLAPTGANTGNGFAVGGGNFRQSYVTIDGAAFNNAFGIGGNLPGGGSPVSIDALDQISVSTSPFDVRQSGFTGGAINAVTKSGTNEYKASAYLYTTNNHLRGNKVGDYDEFVRTQAHSTMYGFTIGGPIIKDKLFFFINGELEDNVTAGPTAVARTGEWNPKDNVNHRPTVAEMTAIQDYLMKTYDYNPGAYQGYSDKAPAHKILVRLDWNIDENNKVNLRFSNSKSKSISAPSTSVSPLTASKVYPGNAAAGIGSSQNIASNAALYFQSQRYSKDYNFTSVAAEWNAKWGVVNNTVRGTYSYQYEPRSYEGGTFPTTHILKDGAAFAAFGPDLFTAGNKASVKTFVGTEELSFSLGLHKLIAGLQFETNTAENGFMQGGNGMFVYNSWDDFVNKAAPAAYLITMSASADGSQFVAKMKTQQLSLYVQDQMNLSDRFRLTAGLRMEKPIYPALENNYNHQFADMIFDNNKYTTDQLPDGNVTISPRIGFNWDITGDQRFVLRGGTGYFIGRLPFVWLVSVVGNSNCGQIQYGYQPGTEAYAGIPTFSTSVAEQISTLDIGKIGGYNPAAPSKPTIIDRNLSMNAVWKTSIAIDMKLPYDIDFTLEGLYSRDYNPAVIRNVNMRQIGNKTIEIAPGDFRPQYAANTNVNPFLITNGGNDAYYYSITASLAKKFNFGLDLKASYTYSKARSYGDGIGDQVTSAYSTNRYSVGAVNGEEVGYGTYVSPNRLLIAANYRKEYAKHFASTIGLVYEGMNNGFIGGSTYRYSRFSYTLNTNVIGDGGANNLMYVPASRAALDQWKFTDITDSKGNVYTANQQRDDFWAYIQQDDYLRDHTGGYTERGGVIMPWHHQLDLKFMQDFYLKVGGKRNTLQIGVDIENLPNLINKSWGVYKQVNSMMPLTYNAKNGTYNFAKQGNEVLSNTFSDYNGLMSTYRIQFSVRYIFN